MNTSSSARPAGGDRYLIGVDVGTGSARAGLFDLSGRMLASAKRDISLFREPGAMVEQSSTEIWAAVCASVQEAVGKAGVAPETVAGIGFDATCSLVVLEAITVGLPVITTRYNGAAELLDPPADSRVIADPHDHDTLAAAIEDFLDNDTRRAAARWAARSTGPGRSRQTRPGRWSSRLRGSSTGSP